MPKNCCVPKCTSNKLKNPNLKFSIIPKDAIRRSKWLSAIGRASLKDRSKRWSPNSYHCYVCSLHFITGEKVNNPRHPDYVPSIFQVNETGDGKVERFQRASKRNIATAIPVKKLSLQKRLPLPKEDSKLADDHENFEDSGEPEIMDDSCEDNTSNERDKLKAQIDKLRLEKAEAVNRVATLTKQLQSSNLCSVSVKGDDIACQNMIGLNWDVFLKLYIFLVHFLPVSSITKTSLPYQEQLFLTLIKLRQNLSYDFMAQVKGIPKSTLIDYFWKWIDILYTKIGFMVRWSDRETIFKTIPPVFKAKFPRLTSIIDCFEIFIETPSNLLARAKCYSNYKKHCTIKVFISCSPLGSINYISPCWGGRASDIQIVRESDFISTRYHLPGDQILADRGFLLHDDFATKCSAELITPAFTKGKSQLSAREVETSRKVSSVRIHIERIIGLMKNKYTILSGTMPLRSVQSLKDESLALTISNSDKLVRVCAALTNMGPSIVFKE